MKAKFYDVKAKAEVEAEVTDKVMTKNGRYAFKALTADGRSLTRFVKKEDFDACVCGKPAAAAKCAGTGKKCGCKKK